jgi:hypothetical protein
MIRLLYIGLVIYLAMKLLTLISRTLQSSQAKQTPPSQVVIDVEAESSD